MVTKIIPKIVRVFIVIACLFANYEIIASAQHDDRFENDFIQFQVLKDDPNSVVLQWKISDGFLRDLEGEGKEKQVTLTTSGIEFPSVLMEKYSFNKLIGIPADAQYKVEILVDELTYLEGPYVLEGEKIPKPLRDDFEPGGYTINEHRKYPENRILPETPVVVCEEGWLRNQRFIKVQLNPLQYNFEERSILFHSVVQIEVRFLPGEQSMRQSVNLLSSELFEGFLRNNLVNFETAQKWRGFPQPAEISQMGLVDNPDSSKQDDVSVQNSSRLKIIISKDGLYRVGYDDMVALGLAGINPNTLHLTSQGYEQAYFFLNDDYDNVFDVDEEVIFWAQGFKGDRLAEYYSDENINWGTFVRQFKDGSYNNWKPQFNAAMIEKYTSQNSYWLSWGGTPGPRMNVISGEPGSATSLTNFQEFLKFNADSVWRTHPFTSEETWFWDLIELAPGDTINRAYPFVINDPDPSGEIAVIKGEVMAATNNDSLQNDHHIQVFINDRSSDVNDFFWDGKSRVDYSFQVPIEVLKHGQNNLNLAAISTDNISGESLYFDWFSIEYPRLLKSRNGELYVKNLSESPHKIQVDGFTSDDVVVLDLAERDRPKWIVDFSVHLVENADAVDNGKAASATYSIEIDGSSSDYFFVEQSSILKPDDLVLVQPATFLEGPVPNYIFITSGELKQAVQQLADYRSSESFLTQVVQIEDLYDVFNYGIRHPIAIKNYLKYLLSEKGALPEYMLLVGDGHWNLKSSPTYDSPPQHIPPNLVWVDPWQGEVDSTNLLATVIGDDPLADLSIARLPVNTSEEVLTYLDKIRTYEHPSSIGWQHRFSFIADNTPDPAGDFVQLSNNIVKAYFSPNGGRTVNKYYLNDYNNNADMLRSDLIMNINNPGYGVITYTGHGSIDMWAKESILSKTDINQLTNDQSYSIILSMTCLDGYWIHPQKSSLVEDIVRAANKGSVAAFSPTGLGVATGHDTLLRGFFDSLFRNDEWIIGLASESAKQQLYLEDHDLDLLQTFTVFGDPMLKIQNGPMIINIPIVQKIGQK